jgi:hypothetical protein
VDIQSKKTGGDHGTSFGIAQFQGVQPGLWRVWPIKLGSAKSCMNGSSPSGIFEHLNGNYLPRLIALDFISP